jgi:hypothetical protein
MGGKRPASKIEDLASGEVVVGTGEFKGVTGPGARRLLAGDFPPPWTPVPFGPHRKS